jgi:hypothetical protein
MGRAVFLRHIFILSVILIIVAPVMALAGTITGAVTSAAGGSPLSGIQVSAHFFYSGSYANSATTDGSGNYTINVPDQDDSYRVFASGSGYATEYYDGTNTWNRADSVFVGNGQNVGDIDFAMELPGAISGRITKAEDGLAINGINVNVWDHETGDFMGSATTNGSGDYTIGDLHSGEYRVGVDTSGVNRLEGYYDDTHEWGIANRVVVNSGATTGSIDIALEYGFPNNAGVMNERDSDGTNNTLFAFRPDGDEFIGTLPDDITSVTVETPSGQTHALDWDAYFEEYYARVSGSPELGVYIFTAVTAEGTVVASDHQYVVQNLPIPDSTTFEPEDGAVLTSKTPSFSWDIEEVHGVPLHYQIEIQDLDSGEYWYSKRTMSMSSITLPEGLNPGGSFRWRMRASDSDGFYSDQNRARSSWINFTTAAVFDNHDAVPAFDPNTWNGLVWKGSAFACSVKVVDMDGVAFDGSSHTVKVTAPPGKTFPDGSSERFARFDGSAGPKAADFWLDVGGGSPVAAGEYTFTVTDLDGNFSSFSEQVDVAAMGTPDDTTLTPSNLSHHITATFDNVFVNGAVFETFFMTDISELDPAKWKGPEDEYASINANSLQFAINGEVGRGNEGIRLARPESVTSVQADITIDSISDTRAKARISGSFFNDGSNADFFFAISNNGTDVTYNVSREWFNHQATYQWDDGVSGTLVPSGTGERVTVKATWIEAEKKILFEATNHTQGVSNSAEYVHAGPVYPAINKNFKLQARINLTTSTAPTFDWDDVTGAARYRLRIYNFDNNRTVWRGYTGGESQYTVPPGVLEPNAAYRFRVEAWDKPSPLSIDHYTRTPDSSSDYYIFYTDNVEPQEPFIDMDSGGVVRLVSDEVGAIPELWVQVHDAQGVPDNIESVKVTFPASGHEEFLYLDRAAGPNRGYYRGVSDQPVEAGTYTFTVTDRDGNTNTATVTDGLADETPMSYPDPMSLNAAVNTNNIRISWDKVDDAAFYRVDVYNEVFDRLYSLPVEATTDTTQTLDIPRGLLEEGNLYRYRIKSYREFYSDYDGTDNVGNMDNQSLIPWRSIQYPTFMLSPVTGGTNSPSIDLDNKGVYVHHAMDPVYDSDVYIIGYNIKVSDLDGVPGNISRVYVTRPDGLQVDLTLDEILSDTEAEYYFDQRFSQVSDVVALEGNYTFTVVDRENNTYATTVSPDNLSNVSANMLGVPSGLSPSPDSVVTGTAPAIEWNTVTGAASYKVRIFTSWNSTLHWSDHIPAPATSWRVPYGILEPGTTYAYRVYAYRGSYPAEDLDFASFNLLYYSMHPHFTVSNEPDSDGDGLTDAQESAMCTLYDDADTDDDGILDGNEDANLNGLVDNNETDPCDVDSDNDGIQDGTESGLTLADIGPDTDTGIFIPDADPSSTTDPLDDDSDNDGLLDGEEDTNFNGAIDGGETDPNVSGRPRALPHLPLLLLDGE